MLVFATRKQGDVVSSRFPSLRHHHPQLKTRGATLDRRSPATLRGSNCKAPVLWQALSLCDSPRDFCMTTKWHNSRFSFQLCIIAESLFTGDRDCSQQDAEVQTTLLHVSSLMVLFSEQLICATARGWAQRTACRRQLSFHHVDPWGPTQVVRLTGGNL